MNAVESVVRKARWRMNVAGLAKILPLWLLLGLCLALIGWLVPKLWPLEPLANDSAERSWQIYWLAGSSLLALGLGLFLHVRRAVSQNQAAMEVDRRFGIKERIGSAWTLPDEAKIEAAGQCLSADAERAASRIDVRDEFRIAPSRWLAWSLLPALALAGAWLLPRAEKKIAVPVQTVSAVKPEIKTAIEQAKKQLEEKSKKISELGLKDMAGEMETLGRKLDELDAGSADLKKEALIKLNDLKDKLQREQAGLGDPEELKKTMGNLGDLKSENARELNDALKKSDFGAAQDALKKVLDKLKEGKLSKAELEKMAKDMKGMAEGIKKLAAEHKLQKQQLQDKLKEAQKKGDLQEAAKLQEQLEKKEQLNKQMQQLKQMAENMQKCSDCMKPGGQPGAKPGQKPGQSESDQNAQKAAQQSLEDMMQQMSEMEVDQATMEALQDLEKELQECKDGMNQCEGQGQGKSEKPGWKDWAKGEGRGGGQREMEETDTGEYKSQVKGAVQKGQTVVTGDADGENVAGVTLEMAREQIQASMSRESDPIEDQQLQRRQRQHALEYFQKLRDGK